LDYHRDPLMINKEQQVFKINKILSTQKRKLMKKFTTDFYFSYLVVPCLAKGNTMLHTIVTISHIITIFQSAMCVNNISIPI